MRTNPIPNSHPERCASNATIANIEAIEKKSGTALRPLRSRSRPFPLATNTAATPDNARSAFTAPRRGDGGCGLSALISISCVGRCSIRHQGYARAALVVAALIERPQLVLGTARRAPCVHLLIVPGRG